MLHIRLWEKAVYKKTLSNSLMHIYLSHNIHITCHSLITNYFFYFIVWPCNCKGPLSLCTEHYTDCYSNRPFTQFVASHSNQQSNGTRLFTKSCFHICASLLQNASSAFLSFFFLFLHNTSRLRLISVHREEGEVTPMLQPRQMTYLRSVRWIKCDLDVRLGNFTTAFSFLSFF